MELRQLRQFVAVAEEGSFTRAARRVGIVQSALSTSIKLLEQELQAPLLARTTRQVRLTAAGEAFLAQARAALEALAQGQAQVAELITLRRGRLAIGTVQSLPPFLGLPALLAQFHRRHPDIEVRLCQGSAPHLVEKTRARQLDLAILPIWEPQDGLSAHVIACDGLVPVCAPGHPLAQARSVTLARLAAEPFVDFEPGHGTRRLVDRGFAEAGLERRIACEASDLETLLELVAHGLGVALVPEGIAAARRDALVSVPLEGAELCWELVVAHAGDGAGLDAAPAAFLRLLAARAEAAP